MNESSAKVANTTAVTIAPRIKPTEINQIGVNHTGSHLPTLSDDQTRLEKKRGARFDRKGGDIRKHKAIQNEKDGEMKTGEMKTGETTMNTAGYAADRLLVRPLGRRAHENNVNC